MENFDDIYSDPTYGEFEYIYARGTGPSASPRPTVVYVGANDGTLHAFNAGVYRPGSDWTSGDTEHGRYTMDYPSYYTSALGFVPDRGEEIWAFVPRAVLPHLQWLTDPNYTHVYYVDQKPKIADVRIFPDDSTHPNGWGTVLIGGLRMGGGLYEVDDFNQDGTPDDTEVFSSCYFALDITNPGAPELLWEFTDPDHLGFTSGYPAMARVGDPERTRGLVRGLRFGADRHGRNERSAGFHLRPGPAHGQHGSTYRAEPGGRRISCESDGRESGLHGRSRLHGHQPGLPDECDLHRRKLPDRRSRRLARRDVPNPARKPGHGDLPGPEQLDSVPAGIQQGGPGHHGATGACNGLPAHPLGVLGHGSILHRGRQGGAPHPELLRREGHHPHRRLFRAGSRPQRPDRRHKRCCNVRRTEHSDRHPRLGCRQLVAGHAH